jgi:peptide chain release factor 3
LTEKFLLYGGAVQLAGSVTARKAQSATTSDWMELEKQRGISVSSTVLQFEYRGFCINLLDTPGHRDFSEDTYRVLMAVDAVVMVIDAAKGIESQTLKLFEMCRLRGIPIFTFVNKFDRPARDPLAIIDELEQTLQLHVCAMNWPLGDGAEFRGVYDRQRRQAHFFERTPGGAYRSPVAVHDVSDPQVRERLSQTTYAALLEQLEMLDAAGERLDPALVASGDMTPVFLAARSIISACICCSTPSWTLRRRPVRAVPAKAHRAPPPRFSPASSLRSSRTWTPSTATRSPSCVSAPGCSRAT